MSLCVHTLMCVRVCVLLGTNARLRVIGHVLDTNVTCWIRARAEFRRDRRRDGHGRAENGATSATDLTFQTRGRLRDERNLLPSRLRAPQSAQL